MKIKEIPLVPIKDIDVSLPPSKNQIEVRYIPSHSQSRSYIYNPTILHKSVSLHSFPLLLCVYTLYLNLLAKVEAIHRYCERSGRTSYDVKKYLWMRRRNEVTRRKIVKYVEAMWRCLFYTAFCILGYQTLFVPETASWIVDTKNHWLEWPFHPMSQSLMLYYQVELGCYFHQLVWTEVSRSDALEMILHHIITILLIVASFLTSYTRIGASILFLHDLADIILESAKVLNYTSSAPEHRWLKTYSVVDILFGVFAVTFFVTRLVLYPRFILYSVIVEGVEIFGCEFGGCYVFIGLLLGLQFLHIFWFYLIMRMVVRLVFYGSVEKDVRSDDEEVEDSFDASSLAEDSSASASTAGAGASGGGKPRTKAQDSISRSGGGRSGSGGSETKKKK